MSEFKYNVSVKVGDTQLTARADTLEDVVGQIEDLKSQFSHKGVSSDSSEPQGISDSYCDIHKVEMKQRKGPHGSFYSHWAGKYPDGSWCTGK